MSGVYIIHAKRTPIGKLGGKLAHVRVDDMLATLFSDFKEEVKKSGINEMYLSSTKTSKKFYEKQGFVQYKEDDSTLIGGVPVEGHPMKFSFN